MSEHAQAFVSHLANLADRDRGGLAVLRRSLGFEPGAYPPAYPHVERFVGRERHADDPYRRALYLVAGLFALHPENSTKASLAAAFGTLARQRDSGSIEQRFVALLEAEPESLANMLRQAVSLLAADRIPLDYARLVDDLSRWLNPLAAEARDSLRQQWARDFYRAYDHASSCPELAETSLAKQPE